RCSWTCPQPTTRPCASRRASWGQWACSRSRPSSSASTSTGCCNGSRSRATSSGAEGGCPVAAGTLYVVATPIGNLEDVTLRALRVLREVDLIAAERFVFEGFLPSRPGPRAARLAALVREPRALVFFEAARRLAAFLAAAEAALGDREAAIARELTKRHEEILRGRLSALRKRVARRAALRGEVT